MVVNRGAEPNSGTVRVFAKRKHPVPGHQLPERLTRLPHRSSWPGPAGSTPTCLSWGRTSTSRTTPKAPRRSSAPARRSRCRTPRSSPPAASFPAPRPTRTIYQVVAQTTGTLDFQVYFNALHRVVARRRQLDLQVFDAAGDVIAAATPTPTFGALGTTGNARVRIPVVAGQSYLPPRLRLPRPT